MLFVRVIILLLLSAGALRGQAPGFLRYSVAEGLPQSQVWCVCSDKQGFLWLGTQGGGLCRFDGERFEAFTTENGLPSNFIHSLYHDGRRLWIGTNRGMGCYDGKKFSVVPGGKVQINAIAKGPDGEIWTGTNAGIWTLVPGQSLKKRILDLELDSSNVLAFCNVEGETWAGTERGLWRFNSRAQKINGIPGNGIYSILQASDKRLWLAAWGVGLICFNPATGKLEEQFRDPLLARTLCLHQPSSGKLWAGTQNNGIVIVDLPGKQLIKVGEAEGLPHPHVRAFAADMNGGLWVATSGGGIARRLRQNFRHYTQEDGLSGARIYAIHEDPLGCLWAAVSQNGIQVRDSAGFRTVGLDSAFQGVKCRTICSDSAGRIWVGTEGRGIAVLDSNGVRQISATDGLPGNWIQKIICDSRGVLWVACSSEGIARIQPDTGGAWIIKRYGRKEGILDPYVSTLLMDAQGRVWFATQTGRLGYLENDRVAHWWGPEAGLPEVPLRALAFDRFGRLWAGTKGQGVWYGSLEKEGMRFRQPARKLPSQNIYLLQVDKGGALWVGSENGVDRLLFDPKGEVAAQRHYGKSEGFLGIETCQDAVICDRQGRVWFGTMNGLTCYTPGDDRGGQMPPPLHFEKIALFYKAIGETPFAAFAAPDGGLLASLSLPYQQNHLSFEFRAVDLENPGRVRYRWRLKGAEENWSPPSPLRSVNYASLAPGTYTFEVQAASEGAQWSKPQRASFTIEEPFWQTTSFRLIALIVLIALIALIALASVRRFKARERRRREELEVQNRFLQLEQKALQLQMNPHFIFNALTSIQSLITEKDFQSARQEINHFAKLMRSILNNSRRQTISLKEEADTLEQYLQIERFCHQGKFDFEIVLPENADPEEVELPPMLLQPFVENAVVHGVSHLQYPGKIEIYFRTEGELLVCTITDNGIGRERAARLREEKKPGHQSVALQVTQERLEALRAGRHYRSLLISDVQDEKGEIAGTRVEVRLPLVWAF